MNANHPPRDQMLVVIHDGTAYVHVVGRGTFKNSVALKQFGTMAMEQEARAIVLDMAECVGMDSTFMGVLAGLAFRLKQKCGGEISMVNLSARTRSLLATLGLDRVIRPFMAGTTPIEFLHVLSGPAPMQTLEESAGSRRSTTEVMLEAHQNLVEVTPSNVPKFTDVLAFLREDLAKAEREENATEDVP